MGQAKQRGTFEQRKEAAIQREVNAAEIRRVAREKRQVQECEQAPRRVVMGTGRGHAISAITLMAAVVALSYSGKPR